MTLLAFRFASIAAVCESKMGDAVTTISFTSDPDSSSAIASEEVVNNKVDVTNRDIADSFNVLYQTTLLIFKGDKEVYRSIGETTEDLIYEA